MEPIRELKWWYHCCMCKYCFFRTHHASPFFMLAWWNKASYHLATMDEYHSIQEAQDNVQKGT